MITIYVAMHKPDDHLLLLRDYPIFKPIHCGKAIFKENQNEYIPKLGDDTGDNISVKNPNYCELTAMYWVWKNDKTSDIIGLNHYRRYFADPNDTYNLIKEESINELLKESDFLINGCGTDNDNTMSEEDCVYNSYGNDHIKQDMDNLLIGVQKIFPDLYDVINYEIHHSGAMCLCNMFITDRKHFNKYCEFLFPVLTYVESTIDFSDDIHKGYNARVFGFLGERILRPWLKAKNYRAIALPELDWEKYSGYVWS